jgi:hypothetical protein
MAGRDVGGIQAMPFTAIAAPAPGDANPWPLRHWRQAMQIHGRLRASARRCDPHRGLRRPHPNHRVLPSRAAIERFFALSPVRDVCAITLP